MKKLTVIKSHAEGITSEQTPIEIALQVDEEGTTTARALYEFLELTDGKFVRWARLNITDNQFAIENDDYVRSDINVPSPTGGEIQRVDYKLTASFAKKLCMTSKSPKGEAAREYFIKVEDSLKNLVLSNFKVPQTMSEALRLAADIVEENERLKEQEQILLPQAKGYKLIVDCNNNQSMNDFAKSMEWGRNRLYQQLRRFKIFMPKSAIPYQRFCNDGYFKVKYTERNGKTHPYTLITPKGMDYIVNKVQEWGIVDILLDDYTNDQKEQL